MAMFAPAESLPSPATLDNPDWSMIDQEDNCRIRIVYLVLFHSIKVLKYYNITVLK